MSRRLHLRLAPVAPLLALALALAGCGGSATGRQSVAVGIGTTSPSATSTPTKLPTVTPGAQPCSAETSNAQSIVRVGDLLLEPSLAISDSIFAQLPDGTPLTPLKLPADDTTQPPPSWPTSTVGATSVQVGVCNGSTTTPHTIQGARVQLAGFTAYTAQLSAWDICAGYYARPAGAAPRHCDYGGPSIDEQLQAMFTTNRQPGTVVSATQPAPPSEGFGPLPATLPPGVVMWLSVNMKAPSSGTYTFSLSITADGAELPFTNGVSMLLAPVARLWNGQACTAASMLVQIPPATNPPTPYICPVS